MSQETIAMVLLDEQWHTTKELSAIKGKNSALNKMHKRGEICKRVLFIPECRTNSYRPDNPGLKITRIVQFRMNPEWLPVYRRKFGYE